MKMSFSKSSSSRNNSNNSGHPNTWLLVPCLFFILASAGYGLPTASISRLRESLLLVSAPARNAILEERELSSGVLAVAVHRHVGVAHSDWESEDPTWPLVNAINMSAPAVVRRGPILILGPAQPIEMGRWAPRGIAPCSCADSQCGCCTGNLLAQFGINLRQRACMNLTYISEDFEVSLKMSINDRVLYSNIYSGKNPRPVCVPFPRIPSVKFCVRFSNVYFIGRNFHACLALEGRWQNEVVFSREYDCIRMGTDGVAIVKPEEGGGIPSGPSGPSKPDEGDDEDYVDLVFEEEDDDDDDEEEADEDEKPPPPTRGVQKNNTIIRKKVNKSKV